MYHGERYQLCQEYERCCSLEYCTGKEMFHCDTKTRNSIVIETIPACIMEKDINYVKSMRDAVAWNIVQVRKYLD